MKAITPRRKHFRINNPAAFGVLCAILLLCIGGGAYGLTAGVIMPMLTQSQDVTEPENQLLFNDEPELISPETPEPPAEATPTPTPATTTDPVTGETVTLEEYAIRQAAAKAATPTPTLAPTPTPTPKGKLTGHVIAIDAAKSKGASKYKGYSTKTPEYKTNMAVADAVKKRLEAEGATVVMTRSDNDSKVDDNARIKTVNGSSAELCITIMCNSISAHDVRGTQMIVSSKHSKGSQCKKLATAVQNAYTKATEMPLRGTGTNVIRTSSSWTVLNKVKVPNCAIILGHISNKEDDRLLTDQSFIDDAARGIVSGIIDYLG